jgi:hypothetical protein
MKVPLIAPLAAVLVSLAACEQKSPPVVSSAPPSSTPAELSETPGNSSELSSSVTTEQPTAETSPTPSTEAAANNRPVFHSETATQAANQYLNSYSALHNDVDKAPKAPLGNPDGITSNLQATLQQLARDNAELQNQQREVDRQLTPDEKKRLRQYQKNLEQPAQE